MENISFSRFSSDDRQPYAITVLDVDGPHAYSAGSHTAARYVAEKLSASGKYSIIHRMQDGRPVDVEEIYRNGVEVGDLSATSI